MAKTTSKRASAAVARRTLRRTTVALPADLLEAADRAVDRGLAKSRGELLGRALRRELAGQRRAEVDAAFAAMSDDPDYQSTALRTAAEFALSDWEALQLSEHARR